MMHFYGQITKIEAFFFFLDKNRIQTILELYFSPFMIHLLLSKSSKRLVFKEFGFFFNLYAKLLGIFIIKQPRLENYFWKKNV